MSFDDEDLEDGTDLGTLWDAMVQRIAMIQSIKDAGIKPDINTRIENEIVLTNIVPTRTLQ
jgi:hypothetical protein